MLAHPAPATHKQKVKATFLLSGWTSGGGSDGADGADGAPRHIVRLVEGGQVRAAARWVSLMCPLCCRPFLLRPASQPHLACFPSHSLSLPPSLTLLLTGRGRQGRARPRDRPARVLGAAGRAQGATRHARLCALPALASSLAVERGEPACSHAMLPAAAEPGRPRLKPACRTVPLRLFPYTVPLN